jgi:hypothetical protein
MFTHIQVYYQLTNFGNNIWKSSGVIAENTHKNRSCFNSIPLTSVDQIMMTLPPFSQNYSLSTSQRNALQDENSRNTSTSQLVTFKWVPQSRRRRSVMKKTLSLVRPIQRDPTRIPYGPPKRKGERTRRPLSFLKTYSSPYTSSYLNF